jgi:hypothetical protein
MKKEQKRKEKDAKSVETTNADATPTNRTDFRD